jgi:hypothetical protein
MIQEREGPAAALLKSELKMQLLFSARNRLFRLQPLRAKNAALLPTQEKKGNRDSAANDLFLPDPLLAMVLGTKVILGQPV